MGADLEIYRSVCFSEFENVIKSGYSKNCILRLHSVRDLIKYIALYRRELRYLYGFVLPRYADGRRIDIPEGWVVLQQILRVSSLRGMGTKKHLLIIARVGDSIKYNRNTVLKNIRKLMSAHKKYVLILRPVKYMTIADGKIEFASTDYVDVLNFCKEVGLPNVRVEIDLECLSQMQDVYSKLGLIGSQLRQDIEVYLSSVGELAGSVRITDNIESRTLKYYLSLLQKSGVNCPIVVESSVPDLRVHEVRSLLEDVIEETE